MEQDPERVSRNSVVLWIPRRRRASRTPARSSRVLRRKLREIFVRNLERSRKRRDRVREPRKITDRIYLSCSFNLPTRNISLHLIRRSPGERSPGAKTSHCVLLFVRLLHNPPGEGRPPPSFSGALQLPKCCLCYKVCLLSSNVSPPRPSFLSLSVSLAALMTLILLLSLPANLSYFVFLFIKKKKIIYVSHEQFIMGR